MPNNKSPGPDGFTKEFFVASWSTIGKDFLAAIQSFFTKGFLPKGINSTVLVLVPKKEGAKEIRDYRPISCCNVIYKVISKILANRLKTILLNIILRNQSAFVEGRLLMENVLLASELVKDYHKDSISQRCALKIDISKAFDTVHWPFLRKTLQALDIPSPFIHWIMLCVSTASFSVQINGELGGYFNSKRGLWQGCSLSPYLFVICMNVLSNIIDHAARDRQIGYHPKCKNIFLTHLCFADELLVFSDGHIQSIKGIVEIFDSFATLSGLRINIAKSTIYMAGIAARDKQRILDQFAFAEGCLPVKYLGLRLSSKKLNMFDCQPLLDRLQTKVRSWTARHLSYAGRLQLIHSVLVSITNFWLTAFCLPKKCLHEIDRICGAFLWSGPDLNPNKAKVAWTNVCYPKKEGGLGIRNLKDTTKVNYLRLLWRIISHQSSLWVSWIWEYNIRTGSLWSVKPTTTMGSWMWKKLIKHREEARPLHRIQIGDGKSTSFWYDKWTNHGVLFDLFGDRGPIDFGIPKGATIHQAITNRCPRNHRNTLMQAIEADLQHLRTQLHNQPDQHQWLKSGSIYKAQFYSKNTWHFIREHKLTMVWHDLIWFPNATPKFAFCTWLAFQDKLSTNDRIKLWNPGIDSICPLCKREEESRQHLFFTCVYSSQIWRNLAGKLLGADFTSDWRALATTILNQHRHKTKYYLLKYTFQATIYHIWRERNNRLHGKPPSTTTIQIRLIDKTVRNNLSAIQDSGDLRLVGGLTTWFSTRPP